MALLSRCAVAVGLVLCALLMRALVPALRAQASEADVKAAFLYNFTKYIEWPAEAFHGPSEPFRMCVLADEEFTRSAAAIIEGEQVLGRPLLLVVPRRADLPRCQILFIGRREAPRTGSLLAAVAGHPVLTVGEIAGFLDQGGIVVFDVADNRVRFDLDLAAALRCGLTVSSKLVRVARHVRESPGR